MPATPPAPIVRTNNVPSFQAKARSTPSKVKVDGTDTRASLISSMLVAVAIVTGSAILLVWATAIGAAAFAMSSGADVPSMLTQIASASGWFVAS